MSDIEDYAYSPYDDLEDILYDADPAPELADELADHAIHSPVYRDEDAVQSELQEYFSDWEYYSDDYMDDDPTLLRNNPQVGTPPRRPLKLKESLKRGTKRKLAETRDNPPLELDGGEPLLRSIKGTVWARPVGRKTPSYKDGQADKVALMKNWKQAFAVKDNGWGRSEGQADDESWANDMSLADMGLQNVQRQTSFKEGAQEAEADAEEEDGDEAGALDEVEEELHEGAFMGSMDMPGPNSVKPHHSMLVEEDDGGGDRSEVLSASEDLDDEEVPRKRRRVKPELPSPPDSNEAVVAKVGEPQSMSKMKAAAFPTGGSSAAITSINDQATIQNNRVKAPMPSRPGPQDNRKRKATEELEDDGPIKSTTSSRAKRVASTRGGSVQNAPAASRATRSSTTK